MTWLDRLESKLGWLAFPSLLKGYAFLHVVVFGLQFLNPEIGRLLDFDIARIMSGEVWRVFTFLFAHSGFGISGALGALFFVFMIMIAMMMSDALEAVWGVFRTSVFCYSGMLFLIAANFAFGPLISGSGNLFYSSIFITFAVLYPRVEFRIFFFLPVQVRWIALVSVLLLVVTAISNPILFPYLILAHLNCLLWAGLPVLRRKMPRQTGRAASLKRDETASFHRCAVCGRTEHSAGDLHFRVGEDGREFCEEHQP